jgi:DNA adenine methylase
MRLKFDVVTNPSYQLGNKLSNKLGNGKADVFVPGVDGVLPGPFVKWVGGKRQLAQEITSRLPLSFARYFEPFSGGGAILFELMPKNAVVSDLNGELINCYQVIRDDVWSLVELLKTSVVSESFFYQIRGLDPQLLSKVERAARFIYINKAGFNGLYRENSKGQVNTSYGHNPKAKIFDKSNLLAVSQYLNWANITFIHSGYEHIESKVKRGDFVYFDPPYIPLSATANFTSYTAKGFGYEDQSALAGLFRQLHNKGVYLMMSNSNTPLTKDLYKGFDIDVVVTRRSINCDAGGRGVRPIELIIRNY